MDLPEYLRQLEVDKASLTMFIEEAGGEKDAVDLQTMLGCLDIQISIVKLLLTRKKD